MISWSSIQAMSLTEILFLSALLLTQVAHADLTGRVVAVTDGDTIKVLESNQDRAQSPPDGHRRA